MNFTNPDAERVGRGSILAVRFRPRTHWSVQGKRGLSHNEIHSRVHRLQQVNATVDTTPI